MPGPAAGEAAMLPVVCVVLSGTAHGVSAAGAGASGMSSWPGSAAGPCPDAPGRAQSGCGGTSGRGAPGTG